jgi:hypothetical protein
MDKIDVRFNGGGLSVNQHLVATHMAALRSQKDLGQKDTVGRDKRNAPLAPEGDERAESRSGQSVSPTVGSVAAGRDLDPAQLEKELMQNLLHDMPEEVLAAARQIMKGHMKTRTEPTRSLRSMKQLDGMGRMEEVEGYNAIVEDIFDEAPPMLGTDFIE